MEVWRGLLNIYSVNPKAAIELSHAHMLNGDRRHTGDIHVADRYSLNKTGGHIVDEIWGCLASSMIEWSWTIHRLRPVELSSWLGCSKDWGCVREECFHDNKGIIFNAIRYGKMEDLP